MDAVRYSNSAALNDHPCVCERCYEARQQWLDKPVPDAEDLANPAVSYLEVEMRNRFVSALAWDLTAAAYAAPQPAYEAPMRNSHHSAQWACQVGNRHGTGDALAVCHQQVVPRIARHRSQSVKSARVSTHHVGQRV